MADLEARFVAVYQEFYPDVYAYCRRRLGSDVTDDVVADTFLTAWRRIKDIPAGPEALLWLYRVAYRSIGHQWRSLSRRKKLDAKLISLGHQVAPPTEDFVVQTDEARQILEAASRLKPTDYEVLRLASWEQLSHVEIGRVLGITTDAVTQRLYRARKKITKEINRIQSPSPAAPEGGVS
ncbi:MAG: RNA polymerase sigma factor [Acidimicrobiia bacterium]